MSVSEKYIELLAKNKKKFIVDEPELCQELIGIYTDEDDKGKVYNFELDDSLEEVENRLGKILKSLEIPFENSIQTTYEYLTQRSKLNLLRKRTHEQINKNLDKMIEKMRAEKFISAEIKSENLDKDKFKKAAIIFANKMIDQLSVISLDISPFFDEDCIPTDTTPREIFCEIFEEL